jgi:hypothetical protein
MARHFLLSCLLAGGLCAGTASAHHTVAGRMHPVTATVRITEPVMAGGMSLPAGTYALVVNEERPDAAAGQPSEAQRTVDFLQNGRVVASDVAEMFPFAERPVGTSGSTSRRAVVQRLKENDFVRIAVNGADARYLIHLPLSATRISGQ